MQSMSNFQRAILVLVVAALLCSAWMFRYSIVAGPRPLVLDRWTGKVYIAPLSEQP